VIGPGATLSGGGTVSLSGSTARIVGNTAATTLTNLDNTISGTGYIGVRTMTLVNKAAGVIDATGSLVVNTPGETLVNAGLMEATSGGNMLLAASAIDQSGGGTILAAAGGKVTLQNTAVIGGTLKAAGGPVTMVNVDVIGGTLTGTGAGRFNANGADTLDGRASPVALAGILQVLSGATLTVEGGVVNSGQIVLYSGEMMVGAAGVTLSGNGRVSSNNSAGNVIVGASTAATLSNVNDHLNLTGQLGDGSMTLINQAAGTIVDAQAVGLTINTGANTIQNAGLIAAEATGGGVTVASAVNNTGSLQALNGGTLILEGAVTGAGTGRIVGGTLWAQSAFTENVTFALTGGTLELTDSVDYKGKVSGLDAAGSNALDLLDIGFTAGVTKASYSGTTKSGTLTVTDGTHTAKIALIGNYIGSTFTPSDDGHGGTKVVDPAALTTPVASAAHFIAAMSSLGAHGAPLTAAAEPWRGTIAALAAPGAHPA
jgi:hypothetical protein